MTKQQLMEKFIELCPNCAEDSVSIHPLAGGHSAEFKSRKYPTKKYVFTYYSDDKWTVDFQKRG